MLVNCVPNVKIFLRDMRKVKVGADTYYDSRDPHMWVGQYLWQILQARYIMGYFKADSFHKHSHISPSIVNNIFEL